MLLDLWEHMWMRNPRASPRFLSRYGHGICATFIFSCSFPSDSSPTVSCHHHSRTLWRNQTSMQGRQFVPIPKKKHGVEQEQYRGCKRCIGEANGAGKEIDVEESEVEEEDTGEEMHSLDGSNTWTIDTALSRSIRIKNEQKQ